MIIVYNQHKATISVEQIVVINVKEEEGRKEIRVYAIVMSLTHTALHQNHLRTITDPTQQVTGTNT